MTDQAAQAAKASASTMMRYDANKKSMAVSYLLWIFLSGFGAHRYYHMRVGSGLAQLGLFVVGFVLTPIAGIGLILILPAVVWVIVDAFLIPGWVRDHNNKLAANLSA